MEQREIKVNLVHCLFALHLHLSVTSLLFSCFLYALLILNVCPPRFLFIHLVKSIFFFFFCSLFYSSIFPPFEPVFTVTMLPVFFLLTLSSLPSWLGVTCPSLLSSSPSLLLHLVFSSSSTVYFSGEYTAGRTSLLLSHSARLLTHLVDC